MTKNFIRPVAPFYAAAGLWALYILLFPIYWLKDWVILALLTGGVYYIGWLLCGTVRPKDGRKWFQKTGGAAAVLAAVVLLTGVWTFLRRPASMPEVSAGTWISDEGNLLSEDTESSIVLLNDHWNQAHSTVCTVTVVDSTKGWQLEAYASTLGFRWGLGPNDLALVIDSGASTANTPVWHLACGDTLMKELSSQQHEAICSAFEAGYTAGGWDKAVNELFHTLSMIFPLLAFDTTDFYMMFLYNFYTDSGWNDHAAMRITPVILCIASVFAVWTLLDRRRYRNYQDLCEAGTANSADYVPVFWGRND